MNSQTGVTNINDSIKQWKSGAIRKQIAIVGGGVSGLSALKALESKKFCDVILLEAQDHLGGRIRTIRNGSFTFEDGAHWIHGGPKNPLYGIAQKLNAFGEGFTFTAEDYDVKIFYGNGTEGDTIDNEVSEKLDEIYDDGMVNDDLVKYYGQGYGQYFIDRFDKEIPLVKKSSEKYKAWLHFLEQAVNSEEGTSDWNDISARDADHFVDYGDDHVWKNGFDTLIDYLKNSVPSSSIRVETPVHKIIWELDDQPGALVVTDSGSYLVDHVLVTVSIGHLKRHHQTLFYPELPQKMQDTLQGVELGSANKIFMGWNDFWWGEKYVETIILWTKFDLPPEMNWLYGIVYLFTLNKNSPLMMAFVCGNYSLEMERLPAQDVQDHFLFLLRRIYKQEDIPEPVIFRRTQWNSNRWFYGSYGSYVTVEGDRGGIHSREELRKPLKNKWEQSIVRWAGEHTHDSRYGTTDGAFSSGIREATKLIKGSRSTLKQCPTLK